MSDEIIPPPTDTDWLTTESIRGSGRPNPKPAGGLTEAFDGGRIGRPASLIDPARRPKLMPLTGWRLRLSRIFDPHLHTPRAPNPNVGMLVSEFGAIVERVSRETYEDEIRRLTTELNSFKHRFCPSGKHYKGSAIQSHLDHETGEMVQSTFETYDCWHCRREQKQATCKHDGDITATQMVMGYAWECSLCQAYLGHINEPHGIAFAAIREELAHRLPEGVSSATHQEQSDEARRTLPLLPDSTGRDLGPHRAPGTGRE